MLLLLWFGKCREYVQECKNSSSCSDVDDACCVCMCLVFKEICPGSVQAGWFFIERASGCKGHNLDLTVKGHRRTSFWCFATNAVVRSNIRYNTIVTAVVAVASLEAGGQGALAQNASSSSNRSIGAAVASGTSCKQQRACSCSS